MSTQDGSVEPVTSAFLPEIRHILNTDPARMENYQGTCDICRRRMDLHDNINTNLENSCTFIVACVCGHMFGALCLAEWVKNAETVVKTCPTCREDLRPFQSVNGYDWLIQPAPCPNKELYALRPSLGSCCPLHLLADRLVKALNRELDWPQNESTEVITYYVFTITGITEEPFYVVPNNKEESRVEEVFQFSNDPLQGETFQEVNMVTPFWERVWHRALSSYSEADRSRIRLTCIRFREKAFMESSIRESSTIISPPTVNQPEEILDMIETRLRDQLQEEMQARAVDLIQLLAEIRSLISVQEILHWSPVMGQHITEIEQLAPHLLHLNAEGHVETDGETAVWIYNIVHANAEPRSAPIGSGDDTEDGGNGVDGEDIEDS
jgi:hypothetical protein